MRVNLQTFRAISRDKFNAPESNVRQVLFQFYLTFKKFNIPVFHFYFMKVFVHGGLQIKINGLLPWII